MCDSDSEEFASADEDFEEIEPDELEEVLQSVKPSDVSSKKTVPTTSQKSDVEPTDDALGDANVVKEFIKDSVSEEVDATVDATFEKTTKMTRDDMEDLEEKITTETRAEYSVPTQSSKKYTAETNTTCAVDVLENPTTAMISAYSGNNSLLTESDCGSEKETPIKGQNNVSPSVTSFVSTTSQHSAESTSEPKILILKPEKPQLFRDDCEKRNVVTKSHEELMKKEPTEGAEEGWDDFDDDWGDFTVDSARATEISDKGGKQKIANPSSIEKSSTSESGVKKASFRDVDIDDVESKLQDFMNHKDDPPLSSVLDRLSLGEDTKSTAGQSWGNWKPSWGGAAVSFLSTASKSVASITTNITQVIESGIGVPNPEELARRQVEAEAKLKADRYVREEGEPCSDGIDGNDAGRKLASDRFGFDQLVSGVTQISSKVITGGLDTLEGIGKKTMTILQENDPGLLNKRKLLGLQPNDGVVLSQVLREAKAKTEERERNLKQIQKHQYKKKLHFETLFDDYHGLVHLEALEMLSKQASLKLESLMSPLTGKALEQLEETMSEVKELCELPDSDNDDNDGLYTSADLEMKLKEAVIDLSPNVKIDFEEIIKSWIEYNAWITDTTTVKRTDHDIFEKAMHALAQTTALCVLRMHKLAEILLISEHHSTASEADAVVQLTTVFCWHLSGVATRFCSELTKMKHNSGDDNDSALVTNIFLEGSNSTSYVQNAFQLFIPILQLGAA
ncbi:protein FAM114A2 [Anopheles nili]|uniref:protein FAM114A2 n=1 Tax=Anopheles nili TaxID=185578 RepID=UPI00237B412A|nr:protein FAM114A2 [Anopheles nili]